MTVLFFLCLTSCVGTLCLAAVLAIVLRDRPAPPAPLPLRRVAAEHCLQDMANMCDYLLELGFAPKSVGRIVNLVYSRQDAKGEMHAKHNDLMNRLLLLSIKMQGQ